MKAIVILPGDRSGVEGLAESVPLASLSLFGSTLTGHWLEHLARLGAKQVRLLEFDRADQVRAEVDEGARWGLEVDVIREMRQLSVLDACRKYDVRGQDDWLRPPNDVVSADCLPGLADYKLFDSYEKFFVALQKALAAGVGQSRVGARQAKPGVWIGLRSHIAPGVALEGPCWIGEGVTIEKDAHIGANVILEDRAWVGTGAELRGSYLAPDTHLGVATSLVDSLALGNLLIDWKRDSAVRVLDPFLLCSLCATPLRARMTRMANRVMEVVTREPRIFSAKSFGWQGPALR